MTARIHPTAIIEEDVQVGPDTAIWDHAHVRRATRIDSCRRLRTKSLSLGSPAHGHKIL